MLTISKTCPPTPAEARVEAERLTITLSGEALHRAFDQASNQILSSLGYGDFVEEFMKATEGYHATTPGKLATDCGEPVREGGNLFGGWATTTDGKHVAISAEFAKEIWDAAMAAKEARAAAMPTEADALRQFFDAVTRLQELGWMRPEYAIRHGEADIIEIGSSGIHRAAYSGEWPTGNWWLRDDFDTIGGALAKPVKPKPLFPQTEEPQS